MLRDICHLEASRLHDVSLDDLERWTAKDNGDLECTDDVPYESDVLGVEGDPSSEDSSVDELGKEEPIVKVRSVVVATSDFSGEGVEDPPEDARRRHLIPTLRPLFDLHTQIMGKSLE